MRDLDRVESSDNFNFRGVPSFLQVCENPSKQREKFMECLHSYGSAKYDYLIRKKYTFCNEIKIKSIYLNCFSKYIYLTSFLRLQESMMGLRPRQGNPQASFQIIQVSSEALPSMRLE